MPKSFEDARSRILNGVSPLGFETVPLLEATGRALACDVSATIDRPRFDNSAMD